MSNDGEELIKRVVGIDRECFVLKLRIIDGFGGDEVAEV